MCNLEGAHTTEVDQSTPYPVVTLLPYQQQLLDEHTYGASMRLGEYGACIKRHTIVSSLYADAGIRTGLVRERHRHRYEVNPVYVTQFEAAGLCFSGFTDRVDGTRLMEYLELPLHPFFVATQAHPEFTSRFMKPNALFSGLIKAVIQRKVNCAVYVSKQEMLIQK